MEQAMQQLSSVAAAMLQELNMAIA